MEVEKKIFCFHNGESTDSYKYFGAHFAEKNGATGVFFRVWAPDVFSVSVVGDFNAWNPESNQMERLLSDNSIWETFVPDLNEFEAYKYCIISKDGKKLLKADPYAFHSETRPSTASKLFDLSGYEWSDLPWQESLNQENIKERPMNIYELHFSSWRRHEDGSFYSYRDMARELIPYVKELGFTHIEIMPLAEHPFDASWGYQVSGYFSATSRYGTPHDLMYFIDECHKAEIGVIFDWVAAHFPRDEQGLFNFNGRALYEYSDPLKCEHPEWGTMIFDFGKGEVISFLLSNLFFWIEVFHVDGIRVDAVASMLYLDYGKQDGAWRANVYGKNGNLEAEAFLKKINLAVKTHFPKVIMIAEESTTWPDITKPSQYGGLGFDFKWNMGWMNDTLSYFSTDPIFRKHKHNLLTFSLSYAFSESYILPFSHDEVVYGKASLIGKQPGDYDKKFAGLRTMLAYKIAHPGKKLSFMGNELAQFSEWNYNTGLDWNLLDFDMHRRFHSYVRTLNKFYLENSAFWEIDDSWDGFEWISHDDADRNIIIFKRRDRKKNEIICLFNFAPVERIKYAFNADKEGVYKVLLCSAEKSFGGKGTTQTKVITTENPAFSKPIIRITLPPLSATFIKRKGRTNYVKNKRVHCNVARRRTGKQT